MASDYRIGYVVVEYNQASGQPGLPVGADLYLYHDDAEHAAHAERERTAATGRRERHVIAEVVLDDDGIGLCGDCRTPIPASERLCDSCARDRRAAIQRLSPDDTAGWS